jgi:cysteine dioxygenase
MGGRDGLLSLFAHWDGLGGVLTETQIRRRFDRLSVIRADVADCVAFSEIAYQRILIHSGPLYEAFLLCWRSGQGSPIHDHGDSICGVYNIEGTATETVFAASACGRIAPIWSQDFGAGDYRISVGRDIHQMANLAPPGSDLITLHIYSPALTAMRTYRLGETTLADHDRLIAERPRVLSATLRPDDAHDLPLPQHTRKRKVTR